MEDDSIELGQLKMQGWTLEADSIGVKFGSENAFDGDARCTSVESSGERP